ncbi:class I SAM-dependent methyltransferase [Parenemella sanctibonifatiensis]|uniref:SAM-dependent methyltransferase n=1 Tax=Parenemella sanctibonifatiensis TaxID=2016505 RepID=A0A255E8R5_9ACTN|nr:class I SAM-dependent methyltransferase [Parenemella sanctibonifatiensis]OYN87949.1 SAM-dependent methyltransferase [Parenemella sanctibonifatiensis]
MEWITGPEAAELLAEVEARDPDALSTATWLRERVDPQRAAQVAAQVGLRRRARGRFGGLADTLFWTRDGLEQATRPSVATWRAQQLLDQGVRRIVDLGCGLALDARAMAQVGIEVVAVEADATTAAYARANLAGLPAEVIVGDAVALAPQLLTGDTAVFADPARRTARGRSWRIEDLSPPWPVVRDWLADRPGCVKLGPGMAYEHLPAQHSVRWVSDAGDLVECSVWHETHTEPVREAVRLPGPLTLPATGEDLPAGPIGSHLYEPDPAASRAKALGTFAAQGLHRVTPGIAYLTGDSAIDSPWLTRFRVIGALDHRPKALKAWVKTNQIGTLEIKVRGLDIDPAQLRRDLKPKGPGSATIVLTPTSEGTTALHVERV